MQVEIQKLSIKEIKQYYCDKFNTLKAYENKENYKKYLTELINELSWGLKVDLSLMDKDLNDEVIAKMREYPVLDGLKRVLLPLAEGANYKATIHPDWSLLAGRMEIQRLKLLVPETLVESINIKPSVWKNDAESNYYDFVNSHADQLENILNNERDYDLYFFGVRTLEKSYLMRINEENLYLETPQRLYLRIAIYLWMPNLEMIKKYYDLMSTGAFTHASPTMFHAGISKGALASCYLLSMQDDLEKIFKCLGQCAMISKSAGGIGLDITNIRHSSVGHMGQSSGIVPMLKVFDAGMRYVDQCFDPNTIIYTKSGPKFIKNITHGDKLITSSGKFETVAKPMHYNYDGKPMYSIQVDNYFKTVIIAGVHPLLVLTNKPKDISYDILLERLNDNCIIPEYVPAEQLNTNCLIGIPIPKYKKDLFYDVDDCYFYGLFIINGFCCIDNINKFSIILDQDKHKNIILFIHSYFKNRNIQYHQENYINFQDNLSQDYINILSPDLGNLCLNIPFSNSNTLLNIIKQFFYNNENNENNENLIKITWSGGAMFPFNRDMFYNNLSEKYIHSSFLHLSKDNTLALLKGLSSNLDIINTSDNVIECIRYLLLRYYIVETTETIEFRSNNNKLVISKINEIKSMNEIPDGKYNTFFKWNKYLFTRINNIEKIDYTGKIIIELEMVNQTEEGANYLTCIGTAHNGGRRKGSATIFLQPWHIDFPDFILLKRQHGKEERRARDLFYSVWNCDIFMSRVNSDSEWTMFCPKYAPKLKDTYGEEFDKWYLHYEQELPKLNGNESFVRKMSARKLWNELLTTQIESGMPFMTNKDTANYTSNQKNLGLIRSSNLCVEIVEVTDENTISSCNLASIALDEYIDFINDKPVYNHQKLGEITRLIVRGLNRVIDKTYYPLQEHDEKGTITGDGPIKSTNIKYRPLGIGVQALADAFLKMDLAWTDNSAKELNREIFATIYYHAIDESVELAKQEGVYQGFYDSPASKGLLKPDLFAKERARKSLYKQGIFSNHPDFLSKESNLTKQFLNNDLSKNYDWDLLRHKVKTYGLRNSLLIALMPTASSAQIRYKNESFEPFTTNMYVRSVLSGNHLIVNRYMVNKLSELGLWNKSIVNFIIKNEGSIAKLPLELLPPHLQPKLQRIKEQCLTAFELKQKLLVDLCIDRAYYVCQSQSLNIHSKDPSIRQLTSLHFYAWENCLTTGMYYLRTAPSTEAIQFTVEGELDVKKSIICTDEICISCQS